MVEGNMLTDRGGMSPHYTRLRAINNGGGLGNSGFGASLTGRMRPPDQWGPWKTVECAVSASFIVILVDGVGIPPEGLLEPMRSASRFFRNVHPGAPSPIPFEGVGIPTRAHLDVPGLPQSATGHVSILTGSNAAKILGRHVPGFPTPSLKKLLAKWNLLSGAKGMGLKVSYVNAFRPLHPAILKRRLRGAMALAAEMAGQCLLGVRDIEGERALHHEFTNSELIKRGERLPLWTPRKAGRILANISREFHLVLYEYSLTDLAGHMQDLREAVAQLQRVEEFMEGVLEGLDPSSSHLLVCSDHGNLEDLSVKTHTRNPVPTLIWGPNAEEIAASIEGIEDIAPAVMAILEEGAHPVRNPQKGGEAP
jgi:hypothetical protein